MTKHRCLNCNASDASPYDLTVRSNTHEDVFLCDECHDALQKEMVELAD